MQNTQPGVLAIWNDCRAGREAEFEEWFQGEHLLERLAVPGFPAAGIRRYPAQPVTSIFIWSSLRPC